MHPLLERLEVEPVGLDVFFDGLTLVAHQVDQIVFASPEILERPKLLPHKPAMRANLASALGLAESDVNVKATRGEGMGPVGRGEGAVAMATVTCVPVAT